jgi:transcriptional regulator with XRE-family HTH domain
MGDVFGLGRKRPDGSKIVNLRKQKGLKQERLADEANISVRLLRDIEKSNHPVPATTITAIATALQTTPDAVTLSTPDGTPDSSVPLLKLTAIRSAKDLNALASDATVYEWTLETDPSPDTATVMQNLMIIVRRLVEPWQHDEFDQEAFGEIPRLARLQQVLQQLRELGVGVIAAKYVRHSLVKEEDIDPFSTFTPIPGKPKWAIRTEFILRLHLVPAEKLEGDVRLKHGKSLERLLKEARDLPDDDKKPGDMDDEIPF